MFTILMCLSAAKVVNLWRVSIQHCNLHSPSGVAEDQMRLSSQASIHNDGTMLNEEWNESRLPHDFLPEEPPSKVNYVLDLSNREGLRACIKKGYQSVAGKRFVARQEGPCACDYSAGSWHVDLHDEICRGYKVHGWTCEGSLVSGKGTPLDLVHAYVMCPMFAFCHCRKTGVTEYNDTLCDDSKAQLESGKVNLARFHEVLQPRCRRYQEACQWKQQKTNCSSHCFEEFGTYHPDASGVISTTTSTTLSSRPNNPDMGGCFVSLRRRDEKSEVVTVIEHYMRGSRCCVEQGPDGEMHFQWLRPHFLAKGQCPQKSRTSEGSGFDWFYCRLAYFWEGKKVTRTSSRSFVPKVSGVESYDYSADGDWFATKMCQEIFGGIPDKALEDTMQFKCTSIPVKTPDYPVPKEIKCKCEWSSPPRSTRNIEGSLTDCIDAAEKLMQDGETIKPSFLKRDGSVCGKYKQACKKLCQQDNTGSAFIQDACTRGCDHRSDSECVSSFPTYDFRKVVSPEIRFDNGLAGMNVDMKTGEIIPGEFHTGNWGRIKAKIKRILKKSGPGASKSKPETWIGVTQSEEPVHISLGSTIVEVNGNRLTDAVPDLKKCIQKFKKGEVRCTLKVRVASSPIKGGCEMGLQLANRMPYWGSLHDFDDNVKAIRKTVAFHDTHFHPYTGFEVLSAISLAKIPFP